MSIWKGEQWNDGLEGIVSSIEGCGGSLTVEARRLLGALDREEISHQDSIEAYVRYVKGEIAEEQMYQG